MLRFLHRILSSFQVAPTSFAIRCPVFFFCVGNVFKRLGLSTAALMLTIGSAGAHDALHGTAPPMHDDPVRIGEGTAARLEERRSDGIFLKSPDASDAHGSTTSALLLRSPNIADTRDVLISWASPASGGSISESVSTTSRVKVADLSSADGGDTHVYVLGGADKDVFEIDGAVLYLKAGTKLDRRKKDGYIFTVTTTDQAHLGFTGNSLILRVHVHRTPRTKTSNVRSARSISPETTSTNQILGFQVTSKTVGGVEFTTTSVTVVEWAYWSALELHRELPGAGFDTRNKVDVKRAVDYDFFNQRSLRDPGSSGRSAPVAGTTYVYRAIVVPADGEGGSERGSSVLTVTVPPNQVAPRPIARASPPASVTVGWTKPSGVVSGYHIRYRRGNSGRWREVRSGITGTSHTVSSLTSGEMYQFQVRATSSGSGGSGDTAWSSSANGAWSDTVEATPTAPLPPVSAADDTIADRIDENSGITLQASRLLGNDRHLDDDELKITRVGDAVNGRVSLASDGSTVTFGHDGSETTSARFTYTASDEKGNADSATVHLTITPVNDPASFGGKSSSRVDEDFTGPITGTLTARDPDDKNHAFKPKTGVDDVYGRFGMTADGVWTYQPNRAALQSLKAGATHTRTFPVESLDGSRTIVTIIFTGANDAPVGVDDAFSLVRGGILILQATDLLANDTDVDRDNLHITAIESETSNIRFIRSPPTGSWIDSIEVRHDGSATPSTAGFAYKLQDGNGGVSSATVNLSVDMRNAAPSFPVDAIDCFPVKENVPENTEVCRKNADGDAVRIEATDSDGDTLTYTLIEQTIGSSSSFRIHEQTGAIKTRQLDFEDRQSHRLTVLASDARGGSARLNVSIPVQDVQEDELEALSDSFTILEGGSLTIPASTLLENDRNPSGSGRLRITDLDRSRSGNLLQIRDTRKADGSISEIHVQHMPDAVRSQDYAMFGYTVSNGAGERDQGAVSVRIVSIAGDLGGFIHEDVVEPIAGRVFVRNVVSTRIVPRSNIEGTYGTFDIAHDGNWTYVLDNNKRVVQQLREGVSVTETFVFEDSVHGIREHLRITIEGANDAPIGMDDPASVEKGGSTILRFADLLRNDTDVDSGDVLSIIQVGDVAHGRAVLSEQDSTIAFMHDGGDAPGSFVYTLSDGTGQTDTATVRFSMVANAAPTWVDVSWDSENAPDGRISESADTTNARLKLGDLSASDPNVGEALDFSVSDTRHFEVGNHNVLYLKQGVMLDYESETKSHRFVITVTDRGGLTFGTEWTLYVVDANDVPFATDDTSETTEGGTIVVDVLANDIDDDTLQSLTAHIVDAPSNGRAVVIESGDDAGKIRYTHNGGESTSDTFTYKVHDGTQDSPTSATVTIDITSANNAPLAVADILVFVVAHPTRFAGTESGTSSDASASFAQDGSGFSVLMDVLANDIDPDHDTLTPSIVQAPRDGTAVVIGSGRDAGKIRYTGSDADSFTYKVYDGSSYSNVVEARLRKKTSAHVGVSDRYLHIAPTSEDEEIVTLADGKTIRVVILGRKDQDLDGLAVLLPHSLAGDVVTKVEFDLGRDRDPAFFPGFRTGGMGVVDISLNGGLQRVVQEDATVCLPADKELSGTPLLHRYDTVEKEWRRLSASRLDENGSVCGQTKEFSLFAVLYRQEAESSPSSTRMTEKWLARFGRTISGHAVEIVYDRLDAQEAVGHVTLLRQAMEPSVHHTLSDAVPLGYGGETTTKSEPPRNAGAPEFSDRTLGSAHERDVSFREFWRSSSFEASSESSDRTWSVWGRGAIGAFRSSAEDGFSLDGEVLSGYLGVDWRGLHVRGGLMFSQSKGEGSFETSSLQGVSGRRGLEASLRSVYSWLRWSAHEQASLWGLLGFGHGDLEVAETRTDPARNTETAMQMAAAGLRVGFPWSPLAGDVWDLALKADVLTVRMDSKAIEGLSELQTDAQRVRLLLEGRAEHRISEDAWFRPSVEFGARLEEGDAQEGLGAELGGKLAYTNTRTGLDVSGRARWMLGRKGSGFEEWGASLHVQLDPGTVGEGVSFALFPSWGAVSGGAANLWGREWSARPSSGEAASERLNMALSYGVPVFGERSLLTPYAEAGLRNDRSSRTRTGMRLHTSGPSDLTADVFAAFLQGEDESDDYHIGVRIFLKF